MTNDEHTTPYDPQTGAPRTERAQIVPVSEQPTESFGAVPDESNDERTRDDIVREIQEVEEEMNRPPLQARHESLRLELARYDAAN